MKKFKVTKLIGFDTEGTGLDVPHRDAAFAIAICNTSLESVYYEWDVDPFTRKVEYNVDDLEYLSSILQSKTVNKVAHNTPYDILAMEPAGLKICKPYEDTYQMMKRARSNETNYQLKRLGKDLLDIDDDDEQALKEVVKTSRRIAKGLGWKICDAKKDAWKADMWLPRMLKKLAPKLYNSKLPSNAADLCGIYCRRDAERCLILFMLLDKKIGEKERAGYLREMELMPLVLDMQHTGWQVHPEKLIETRELLTADVKQFQKEINQHALIPLTKFTNATLKHLIYEDLELNSIDSKLSVDREHLEGLDHPVADLIIGMRDATGCITKFLNPFESFMVKEKSSYIVYPNFKQSGARTFRFSATRPPIQTIPDASKSKSNMSARQCIGPRKGNVWYMLDYSGLQVRIFASLANDKTMLDSLRKGIKPHAAAARIAWNGEDNKSGLKIISETVALSDHRKEVIEWCDSNKLLDLYEKEDYTQIAESLLEHTNYDIVDAEKVIGAATAYAKAKTIFFAKLFGAGVKSLSKSLGVPLIEGRKTVKEYENAMPNMGKFSSMITKQAEKDGCIVTPFGDVIHIDDGFSYRAVNYIVQGTEAALVKDRMRALARSKLIPKRWSMLGQIHDELAFQAPNGKLLAHKPHLLKIKECMEDHTGHFQIELPVECDRVETYWNEREKVEL